LYLLHCVSSITRPTSTTPGAATRPFAQNASSRSSAVSPPQPTSFPSQRRVRTACRTTLASSTHLPLGEPESAARERYVGLCPRRSLSHSSLKNSLWSDSPKGSSPSIESSAPYPTHKRRQKSFSADSPEVVLTGRFSSKRKICSGEPFTQIISDRTGRPSWPPSAQQSHDAQTEELS
jgi:hypothetical protein